MDVLNENDKISNLIKSNDETGAASWYASLKEEIINLHVIETNELSRKLGTSIFENVVARGYVPESAGKLGFIPISSQSNGNCLYSSISLLLVGDNKLCNKLRLLTSLELYLYADIYVKHPCIVSAFERDFGKNFKSFDNLFKGCIISHKSLDSGKNGKDLIIEEALANCKDKNYSSFSCVLALASVTNRTIQTYYPDFGSSKYKLIFQQKILPRSALPHYKGEFNLLLCRDQAQNGNDPFKHNHFCPMITRSFKKKGVAMTKIPSKQMSIPKEDPKESKIVKTQKQSQSKIPFLRRSPNSKSPTESSISQHKSVFKGELKNLHDMSANSKFPVDVGSSQNNKRTESEAVPLCSPKVQVMINDISTYREKARTMNHSELISLIESVFVPPKSFVFPKVNGRAFRHDWLEKFAWLKYSPSLNGGFCLPCVLFADKHPTLILQNKNLLSQPLQAKPSTKSDLLSHEKAPKNGQSLHQVCNADFIAYMNQKSGISKPIDDILDDQSVLRKSENTRLLYPIIDTILLCGRLGIALRGHRDDSQYHPEIGEYSTISGIGNFIEILNYRARANPEFKAILLKRGKNATYVSKTTQNELIECIGQVISDKILNEIKVNKFFAILGDECMDSAGKEQFALCIRYIDRKNEIKESFLRFIHLKDGLSGEGLFSVLTKTLAELSLDINDCRGQGYDGAGSVAGYISGLQARIMQINQKAVYTHCHSHRLNLCVLEACNLTCIENTLAQIKAISYFFNFSETRQKALVTNIMKYNPEATKNKLADICRTRWVERIKGMDCFFTIFNSIVHTLEEMHLNLNKQFNKDTSSRAEPFFKALTTFDFIICFVLTKNIFDLLLPVTILLQKASIDIMDGIHLIESLKICVAGHRNSVDECHDKWYGEACQIAKQVNVPEEKPRRLELIDEDNETANHFFKRTITIPMLDHLNADLGKRFDETSCATYNGLVIIPENMIFILNKTEGSTNTWRDKFKKFTDFYHDDLPNPTALDNEFDLWETFWIEFDGARPNNITSTLQFHNLDCFQNIHVCLNFLAVIPITSCECERCFSAMKLLKTYNRSTMSDTRLNGLALMYQHKNIIPKTSEVIERFSRKNRRLEL